jgi:hypothetical protein
VKSLIVHAWHGSLYVASLIAHAGDMLCVTLATLTMFVAAISHETTVWQRKQRVPNQPDGPPWYDPDNF